MKAKCVVLDCGKFVHAKKYCQRHYTHVRRFGHVVADDDLWAANRLPKYNSICSIVGCGRRARGMCRLHKRQIRQHGKIIRNYVPIQKDTPSKIIRFDDHAEIVILDRTDTERARAKIDLDDIPKVEGMRWHCTGYIPGKMYPVSKEGISLHHLVFLKPKVETGLVVDHIDRDTLNCRKANLRAVTTIVNIRNQKVRSTNTCGCNGVRYTHKKWIASIAITCEDKKTAIAVRDWLVNARDASGI